MKNHTYKAGNSNILGYSHIFFEDSSGKNVKILFVFVKEYTVKLSWEEWAVYL